MLRSFKLRCSFLFSAHTVMAEAFQLQRIIRDVKITGVGAQKTFDRWLFQKYVKYPVAPAASGMAVFGQIVVKAVCTVKNADLSDLTVFRHLAQHAEHSRPADLRKFRMDAVIDHISRRMVMQLRQRGINDVFLHRMSLSQSLQLLS